jgi:FtsH-binding integral membrane protein
MRSRLWVILWMLGILFPMAFLGRIWPAYGRLFDAIFEPAWMHVVMHALLYAVLGLLLAPWIRPDSPRRLAVLLGFTLLVGCLQEAAQLVSAGVWPGWGPEAFDLCVDLSGVCLGLLLARSLAKRFPVRRG